MQLYIYDITNEIKNRIECLSSDDGPTALQEIDKCSSAKNRGTYISGRGTQPKNITKKYILTNIRLHGHRSRGTYVPRPRGTE
jgi:hypothetical protein